MAASGIMIVIIMLVLSLTTNVLNTWTQSSGRLAQNFEARVALDMLALDIEAMDLRSTGISCLEVRQGNDAGGEATSISSIFFLSKVLDKPGSNLAGDVCAVSYQLMYQDPYNPDPDNPIYGLYRFVIDSESTFNNVLTLGDYDGNAATTMENLWENGTFSTVSGKNNNTITIDAMQATGLTGKAKRYFLSADIADFQLVFYYRTTNPAAAPVAINPGTDFIYADGKLYLGGNYPAAVPDFSHLAYVDISITVLGDEGARLQGEDNLSDAEKLGEASDWDEFIAIYGETFTRRVNLMSYPI